MAGQTGFGPEAGLGICYMHLVPPLPFQQASEVTRVSLRLGGTADLALNKRIYVQAGLFYSLKGGNNYYSFYLSDSNREAYSRVLDIGYLEMPVNVVYKTGMQGKGRFFAGLGASPAYIVSGNGTWQWSGVNGGVPFSGSGKENLANGKMLLLFDIGMNVTAGYELPSGWYVRALFTSGVKDIGNAGETDKNRVWTVSAGYYFGKGRNINQEADDLIDHSPEQK